MKKTIYLRDENCKWKVYQYEDISEISAELSQNKIRIGNISTIGDCVKIGDSVTIGDCVKIGDSVTIGDCVTIGDYVTIGDCVTIGDYVTIVDSATIGDNIILLKSFYITGSNHPVTYCGNGMLSIGCVNKSIEWFEQNYLSLGEKHDYTAEEIEEYVGYIKLAKQFHKLVSQ